MTERVYFDVTPFADHWLITVNGVVGLDIYVSMAAALIVAHEAARVRSCELHEPCCVRTMIQLGGAWATRENFG